MENFNERFKRLRLATGLTQKDFAKKSGLSQATISDIERCRNETSEFIVELALALDVDPTYLKTGLGSHTPLKNKGGNNTVDLSSEKNLHFTPEARRVDVDYSVELVPGQFAPSQPIKDLKKQIAVTPQEFSPTAFAIIYNGSAMGDILEHQQPIILDERKPRPGDLCFLQKDGGFMFCVFESDSPFGAVFRLKGTSQKYTPDNSCIVYKVMSLRNASDVE